MAVYQVTDALGCECFPRQPKVLARLLQAYAKTEIKVYDHFSVYLKKFLLKQYDMPLKIYNMGVLSSILLTCLWFKQLHCNLLTH